MKEIKKLKLEDIRGIVPEIALMEKINELIEEFEKLKKEKVHTQKTGI